MDAFEFTVAEDLGIGVIDLQRAEQGDESSTLLRGTGVFWTTFFVEPAFVTDTNRVGVVVAGMSTDHFFGTPHVELAVTGNIVVVATAVPTFGTVHLVELFERYTLVRPRSRTMNYNQINSTHIFFLLGHTDFSDCTDHRSYRPRSMAAADYRA